MAQPNTSRPSRHWGTLSWQISSLLIGVLAFSLLLNSVLTYFNFEKSYLGLLHSRMEVVGNDIQRSIEYGLNLGLRLDQMRRLQSLVDEVQKTHVGVGAVAVLDKRGETLFGTKGLSLAKDILAAGSGGNWAAADEKHYWVAMPIKNSFEAVVGTLMIGYSRGLADGKLHATLWSLGESFIFTLGGAALLVVLGTFAINGGLVATLAGLEAFLSNECDSGKNQKEQGHALDEAAVAYREQMALVLQDIHALDRQVSGLSEAKEPGYFV